MANETGIGLAIILESCRWIASELTKSLATSSDDAAVPPAGGGGLMFDPTIVGRWGYLRVSTG